MAAQPDSVPQVPAVPVHDALAEPAEPAVLDPDHEPAVDQDEPQLSRRERRAAARGGGPSPKVHGPAASKLRPPPARGRDYAARKGG